MRLIDIAILNKAIESPGRLNAFQLRVIMKIDAMRNRSPYVQLKHWERRSLKIIGRLFDIHPESFIPSPVVDQETQDKLSASNGEEALAVEFVN